MAREKRWLTTREMVLIALFTAVTAVLAQVAIPLPLSPIPVSLVVLAVYITSLLLNRKCALAVMLCYLVLGMVGVPVFANFRAGLSTLVGPTGGYLVAFPLMALVITTVVKHWSGLPSVIVALVLSTLVCYLFGSLWYSYVAHIGFWQAIAIAVLPYLAADCLKMAVAVVIFVPVRQQLRKANYLPLR